MAANTTLTSHLNSAPSALPPIFQVRCRLFGAARTLLEAAGVGAVRPLAPPLLAAATVELYGRKQAAQQEDGLEGPARKKARKGKQAAAADFAGDAAAGVAQGVCCARAPSTLYMSRECHRCTAVL